MRGWDKLREERYARQIESGLINAESELEPRPEPQWDLGLETELDAFSHMQGGNAEYKAWANQEQPIRKPKRRKTKQ